MEAIEEVEAIFGPRPDSCPESLWELTLWRALDFMTRPEPRWHCRPVPHPCNCSPHEPRRGW